MIKKQERTQKLVELQLLDMQIKQLEQQFMQIEEQVMDVNMVISNLSELNEIKPDKEILAPIANGVFVKAQIKDTNNLKVNVGNGVFVEKTIKETQDMLTQQISNIHAYKDQLFKSLQETISKAGKLQKELKEE